MTKLRRCWLQRRLNICVLLMSLGKLPMLWVWELSQHSSRIMAGSGIIIGDTFRRGVARTMAQQCAKKFEEACMPFQYALSTRAGTDCVARDGTGSHEDFGFHRRDRGFRPHQTEVERPSTTMLISPLSFLSSGCSAARIPCMCGATTRECHMRSCRVRGVSRETPSCQHCMPWASTKLSHKFMPPSVKVSCSSRIWTTFTSSATLLALQRFSFRSNCRSSGQLASK